MPDLDLIKQAEQEVRDRRGRFATGRSGNPVGRWHDCRDDVKSSPSPRLRGEGRGEGLLFEFGQECLENTVEILNDIVVPDADYAMTEGAEVAIALLVFRRSECWRPSSSLIKLRS